MEEEPVQLIRETSRNMLYFNRKKLKDDETDVRRSLGKLQISQSDVTAIASKLKTKTAISSSDLRVLQNALADDPRKIQVVLNTYGALRGLVRELSGHDVSKQIQACGCLCNLSLGDSKACCIIAKSAVAYLVAALDCLTVQLSVSCAWTLANLAGSGKKACELLIAQGAVAKLCDVIASDDVTSSAIEALTQIAYVMKDELSQEHLLKIIEAISNIEITTESSRLLFILTCHIHFTQNMVSERFIHKIVDKFNISIQKHINICRRNNGEKNSSNLCCDLEFIIRVLANLNSDSMYRYLIENLVSNNLVDYVRKLIVSNDFGNRLLWLLGNIFNFGTYDVFFEKLLIDVPL